MPHVTVNGKTYSNRNPDVLRGKLEAEGYQAEREKDIIKAHKFWQASEYILRQSNGENHD